MKHAKLPKGWVYQSWGRGLLEFSLTSRSRLDPAFTPGTDLYCFGLAGLLNRANFSVFPGVYASPESFHILKQSDPEEAPFHQVNFYKPPERFRK